MTTGSPVIEVRRVIPPSGAAGTFARIGVRAGGSTPNEAHVVHRFAAGSTEYLDFLCRLSEDYDGNGFNLTPAYMMASATSGGVRLEAAIRRLDTAEDVDGAHTYDFNGVTDTVPGTSGFTKYPTIAFADGADMDGWAAGEYGIVRLRRKHDDAGDDAAGDLELRSISGVEA